MGPPGLRLIARAMVALGLAAYMIGGASVAAAAGGGKTIAQAPAVKVNTTMRGSLYDSAFYSGYSVAFWTGSFTKGDRISIRTTAADGDTPPCQLLYMPGTDDLNVGATTPLLEPAHATRHEARDFQRWATAPETGTYVLAMSNADIYLSGPHQCLAAPAERPFTFKVTVARRGSGSRSAHSRGRSDRAPGAGPSGSSMSTQTIKPGQSLWMIAQDLVGEPAGIAEVAFEVGHLWKLNAARIGSGDPDLIYAGLKIRLK